MNPAPFKCKFCGGDSWIDPSDQCMPPDYCHESDHGTEDDRVGYYDIKAYRNHIEGPVEVKEYMRYTDHTFIVDGVAKMSLPDEFWEDLARARIQKAKDVNTIR